jgi:hypothetical protein
MRELYNIKEIINMKKFILLSLIAAIFACSDVQKPVGVPPINASILFDTTVLSTFRVKTSQGTWTAASQSDFIEPILGIGSFPAYHLYLGVGPTDWTMYCTLGTSLDSVNQKYVQKTSSCLISVPHYRSLVIKTTSGDVSLAGNLDQSKAGKLQLYDMVNGEPRWLVWPSNTTYIPFDHLYLTSQIVGDTSSTATVTFGPLTKRPTNVVGSKNPAYVVANWTNQDVTASTEVWFGLVGAETYRATVLPTVSSYFVPRPGLPNGTYRFKLRHVKLGVATTPDFTLSNTVTIP